MGCAGSSRSKGDETVKIRKPKPWKHSEQITRAQLVQMRDEFWDTAPHYGGRIEIWDALRAAAEADVSLAQAIVDSAEIIVQAPDLTVCYDERDAKYELPKYVLSEPTNLTDSFRFMHYGPISKYQESILPQQQPCTNGALFDLLAKKMRQTLLYPYSFTSLALILLYSCKPVYM
ncbi:hypothetical protein K7X08_017982 [Anisodus acutangulus]|uniref:DC-UbP/UBTD2 N-terminal domain-containing protein n=1 Tax=Anisodus acutangulus TaxID=402998 RepID=A0A9Q1R6U8_9SOLA|nr:hypothetical protein K7X08_017982 [Anisodus acutangulus]